jgi:hypothetical protein
LSTLVFRIEKRPRPVILVAAALAIIGVALVASA